MYIYPEPESPITPLKAVFLAILSAVWVGTGLIGHDPWKPEDAQTFWLVYDILRNGDWLVPSIAGEPYMDKPPLFYMTAALFAKLFSPWLALHDGARLASGFYTALTLLFTGLAGRELFGTGRGWAAVVILIGCLGMLVSAHQLIPDLALLTACAAMFYGYALSWRRPWLAGLLLGSAMGVGFMAKGFIAPTLFLTISPALLLFREWRVRTYWVTLGVALVCALPWLTLWPYLLYRHSPGLFMEWAWVHNIGRWFKFARAGQFEEAYYYLKILPWFAWPALPLAMWALWHARKRVLSEPSFQLLLTGFLVMLVMLSLVPNIKDIFALPMLLPLALLASASLSTLRRGAANALDWFGIMTFGFLAILMWWGWAGLLLDNHAKITQLLKEYQPGFEPAVHGWSFGIAVCTTVLWVILVWRVGRSMRRAVINWAAGTILLWVLAMSIWLPWLDSGKSYRNMVLSLRHALPPQYGCIRGSNMGVEQRAMLEYFGGISLRVRAAAECELLLTRGGTIPEITNKDIHWNKVWEGGRMSDRGERFRLYRSIR